MVRIVARGGETIGQLCERAIEIQKVSGDDTVVMVHNGLVMQVFSNPLHCQTYLWNILTDMRNERRMQLPEYLIDKETN